MNTVQFSLLEPTSFCRKNWVISVKGKLWNNEAQCLCEETWLLDASFFSTEEEAEKCLKKARKSLKKINISTVHGKRKASELATVRQLKPFEENIINNNIEAEKIEKGEID